jgi:hypothetical protein
VKSWNEGRLKLAEFWVIVAFVLLVCVSILFVSVTVAFAVRRSVVNSSLVNQSAPAPKAAEQNASAMNAAVALSQKASIESASVSGTSGADSSGTRELSTISGMVTDSYCGARHSRNSNRSSTECVRYCTHRGASYILVSSGGAYMLRGNKAMFSKFAGQRAKVTGTLDGRVIGVRSMAASE